MNTLRLSALTIVAPSLIVPFSGIALFAYWALTTGMTLVPANDIGWVALIPHSVTLVVEFQAYLLLLLGAYLLGRAWVGPRTVGAENRRQGYLRGLRELGWLALPALALLIVGAMYEAFSLRYFVHPLAGRMASVERCCAMRGVDYSGIGCGFDGLASVSHPQHGGATATVTMRDLRKRRHSPRRVEHAVKPYWRTQTCNQTG